MSTAAEVRRPGIFWKFYAVGAVIWLGGTLCLYIDDPSLFSGPALVDAIVLLLCLFPLFGYAFQRPFLNARTWQIFMPLVPVWDVLYLYLLPEAQEEPAHASIGMVVGVLFILLAILKYGTLARYAYASPHIWEQP
jgi:hypothetical protein